ncbi:hypothetical protein HpMMM95_10590 [Helicobacter pylori]
MKIVLSLKNLAIFGLKEAEIKRDTEILREKNLKEQRRQKEEQEKNLKRIFKSF